jgi:hypothetical protein
MLEGFEKAAREAKTGLRADPQPVSPWKWRKTTYIFLRRCSVPKRSSPSRRDYFTLVEQSLQSLDKPSSDDGLAYLAVTSKPELAIRDRLAFRLQQSLGTQRTVGRELSSEGRTKTRVDIAVLNEQDFEEVVIQVKARTAATLQGPKQLRKEARKDLKKCKKHHAGQCLYLGDYPELDREQRSTLRCLGYAIALFACFQFAIPEPVFATIPHKSEATYSFFMIKPIAIPHSSVDINCGTFICKARCDQWSLKLDSPSISWSNNPIHFSPLLSVENRDQRDIFNAYSITAFNICGRNTTEVFNRKINPWSFRGTPPSGFIHNLGKFHHGIGTQLPTGSVLGTFNEFVSGTHRRKVYLARTPVMTARIRVMPARAKVAIISPQSLDALRSPSSLSSLRSLSLFCIVTGLSRVTENGVLLELPSVGLAFCAD